MSNKGAELEVLVAREDEDGLEPVHEADQILYQGHRPIQKEDGEYIGGTAPEVAKSMMEVVTSPNESVMDTGSELVRMLKKEERKARKADLTLMPIDMPFGDFTPEMRENPRYNAKAEVLGPEKFKNIAGKVQGQHTHVEVDEENLVTLLNEGKALDPVAIALTASSPRDGFDNWRVHAYREVLYEDSDVDLKLRSFKEDREEYEAELERNFEYFINRVEELGQVSEGMTPHNVLRGPVSYNQKYGTLEFRTAGANPDIGLMVGYLAMMDGALKRSMNGDSVIKRVPGEDREEKFEALRELSERAKRDGLKDPAVRSYTADVLQYAREGLDDREEVLLDPVEGAVSSGINTSDRIRRLASDRGLDLNDASSGPQLMKAVYDEIYQPSLVRTSEVLNGLRYDQATDKVA